MTAARPSVGVVVLAWQAEPYLAESVQSILDSTGVDVKLVLVDNGGRAEDLARIPADDRVTVLRPGRNTGFAGGCNLGVAALNTDYAALVNSDCLVHTDTLVQLATEAARPQVGLVMASIRLAEPPHLINSAGNPVHLVGLSWAGEMNSVEMRTEPYDVTGASGACTLMRRSLWLDLNGFDEEYFAYLEDTEMSLRAWRRGLAVRCVPTAVALHHYEFSRNTHKMFLLERNRLMMLATLWSTRALIVLAPVLLATELMLAVYAMSTGWGRQKFRGWVWVWRNRSHLHQRRQEMQDEQIIPDAAWMGHLTPALDHRVMGLAPLVHMANVVFRAYWTATRRLL